VAILIAYGINLEGRREVLGVSVALSEAEVHWRAFLQSLCERKLHGVKMYQTSITMVVFKKLCHLF
jgi:transposase-like protein